MPTEPEHITNDAPAYLQRLGLASAPFSGAPDATPYFNAPSRRKMLDMVLYLARYSDLALLVHGPTGCGKNALLREAIARAGLNIHAVTIRGHATLGAHELNDTLINSFKLLHAPPAAEQQLAQIKEQLDHLQRKGYHCIVFVDQADRLTPDASAALEQLIDLRSEAGRNLLNIVLFAQQPDKLALRGPSVRHRIKRIDVPPLAADEVGLYLQHRMHHAGGDALFATLFNERSIAQIAREAQGWPGAINALAQQRLTKFAARKHPGSAPAEMRAFSKMQFASMAVAASALLAVFAFQEEINRAFKPSVTAATAPDPLPAITVPAGEAPEPAAEITAPAPTDPIVAVATVTPEPVVAPETPPTAVTPEPEPELAAPATMVSAKESAPAPETGNVPATASVVGAQTPARKPTALRDDWLLAQNPEVYTLQVAGSPDESDVRRALRKYGFVSDTAIFTTHKKGKPWYGLVTGIYADQVSAQQARAALPEELMRGTWVRRMRAVQGEINKPVETESPNDVTGNRATPPPKASETN